MNKKLEIVYGNGIISDKIKKNCYDFFGIDIVDILDDIFSFDRKKNIDYQDIRWQIATGRPIDMRSLNQPNFLKSVIITDFKIENNKPLYLDVIVKEAWDSKKYIIYFDINNSKLIVEEDKELGINNLFEYKITSNKNKATKTIEDTFKTSNETLKFIPNDTKDFQESHAILIKEIFKNEKKDATELVKLHTNKGNRGIILKENGLEFNLFKYRFENNKISANITLKIENKKSIRSYAYKDFEKNALYYKKIMVPDIADAYIASLSKEDNIESSLTLYDKLQSKLQNIPDEFNYTIEIQTRSKHLTNKSTIVENITDTNGTISLSTKDYVKKKIKK